MKLKLFNIFLGIGAMAMLASCDHVNGPDRFIPYEKPDANKNLLIQEFTGMRCVNCPKGAEAVHDITEALDGKVVAICIHPENHQFTVPIDGLDLTSPISTELYDHWHPNFPAAVFDGGAKQENLRRWSAVAMTAFEQPTPLNIEVTSSYNASTRTVTGNYKIDFVDAYTGDLNITMYITEDNIIGTQESTGGVELHNYSFQHVLRTAFNGAWGESIGSVFVPLQTIEGSYEVKLKEDWKAENCNVVGFVSQPKGIVYNAAQCPVMQ